MKTWKIPERLQVQDKFNPIRAGVILINEDNVLIVRTYNIYWGFPKGAVRKGEDEEETASRELYEESGIYISPATIKNTSFRLRVSGGVLFVLEAAKKLDPNVATVKSVTPNDSSGVGWVNIGCIIKHSNLICNNQLRKFIEIVSKNGIDKWRAMYTKST
jgi:8-oxo-dGTP pyrophosphatase MutT (NUDIX family)